MRTHLGGRLHSSGRTFISLLVQATFIPEKLRGFLLVREERNNVQDIEFSIQKIVEIALRVIFPRYLGEGSLHRRH